MNTGRKRFLICMLAILMVAVPLGWSAHSADCKTDRTAEEMAADFFVVRPLSAVATAAGSVLFVVSLPFSAMGGNTGEAYEKLIKEPAAHTFKRPLGDIELF